MKLEELRKVIREEVEKAFKEQLKEVLLEAIQIASTPSTLKTEQKVSTKQITDLKPMISSAVGEGVTGTKKHNLHLVPQQKKFKPTGNPIEDMLQMTKASMTSADAKAIMGEGAYMPNMASSVAHQVSVGAGNQPGIDLSQLPFISKAKTILEAAYQKDKQRQG